MKILSVNNYNYYTNFGINLQSPKLRFKEDDFYVRIKGYGHHSGWAKKIKETADNTVFFIRKICNFEEALKQITKGVTEANQLLKNPNDIDKRNHTGILRIKRDGWNSESDWNKFGLITRYKTDKNRYKSYADRFDYIIRHPLKNPYSDVGLTRPKHDSDYLGKFLDHADKKYINNAFSHIKTLYDTIYTKYIVKEANKENLEDINYMIAEIRWILAHATPWERGSDAISNTFIRAIYKAIGIKAYPLKKGVSLDLEAYCTNLDEYKKNFAAYFTKKPDIVD